MKLIDWDNPGMLKVVYSTTYDFFREAGGAVSIFRKKKGEWVPIMPDMSPVILERANFPKIICKTAHLVALDRRDRIITEDGKIVFAPKLFVPPAKPKLFIPK